MPAKKLDDGKREMLLQMCSQYLGLQSQHQQERMQKIIECMDEESLQRAFAAVKLDLIAAYKRQIASLNQAMQMMG